MDIQVRQCFVTVFRDANLIRVYSIDYKLGLVQVGANEH